MTNSKIDQEKQRIVEEFDKYTLRRNRTLESRCSTCGFAENHDEKRKMSNGDVFQFTHNYTEEWRTPSEVISKSLDTLHAAVVREARKEIRSRLYAVPTEELTFSYIEKMFDDLLSAPNKDKEE